MSKLARYAGTPRVLLVGAGHAHIEVLRQAAARPARGVELVLALDRAPAIYSGMLPGFVAGQYRAAELAIDAVALAQRAGAEIVLERVCRVDAAQQRVMTLSGREIRYDFASLDVGSGVLGNDLPGVDAFALPVRPIERLIAGVESLVAQARQLASARGPSDLTAFRLLVVGAGAGGVELAFCFEARLRAETRRRIEVTLLERGATILPGAAPSLVRRVTRAAHRRGIELIPGAEVAALERGVARLAGGRALETDAVLWSPGPAAHAFLRESSLPVDARGFVRVRPTLQVEGSDTLFAVGDCASLAGMAKAGVYAVRCWADPGREPAPPSGAPRPASLSTAARIPVTLEPRRWNRHRRRTRNQLRRPLGHAPQGPHRPPLHGEVPMTPTTRSSFRLACLALIGAVALTSQAFATEPAEISRNEVQSMRKAGDGFVLVDVRTPEEFASGHVPGAVNIQRDQLPRHFAEFKAADEPIVVYCERGPRALAAADMLLDAGFTQVRHLTGDMAGWRTAGLPIAK